MKFVCDGTILSDAALTVSKACAVKTITPVLECIKLCAENDGLTLTAYDGEISIEKKIKAEVLEEGELCVNGKTFADFVGKIAAFECAVQWCAFFVCEVIGRQVVGVQCYGAVKVVLPLGDC